MRATLLSGLNCNIRDARRHQRLLNFTQYNNRATAAACFLRTASAVTRTRAITITARANFFITPFMRITAYKFILIQAEAVVAQQPGKCEFIFAHKTEHTLLRLMGPWPGCSWNTYRRRRHFQSRACRNNKKTPLWSPIYRINKTIKRDDALARINGIAACARLPCLET